MKNFTICSVIGFSVAIILVIGMILGNIYLDLTIGPATYQVVF